MNFANKTITDEIAIAQYQKIWDKLTVEQMATELEYDSIDIGRDSSVLSDIINGMEAIKDKIEDDKNQRGIYNKISILENQLSLVAGHIKELEHKVCCCSYALQRFKKVD